MQHTVRSDHEKLITDRANKQPDIAHSNELHTKLCFTSFTEKWRKEQRKQFLVKNAKQEMLQSNAHNKLT